MNNRIYQLVVNNEIKDVSISKKRIKSLRLKINENQNISLSIPTFYPYNKAIEYLNSKLSWIEKTLSSIKKNTSNSACGFNNGDKICLWGQNVDIQIITNKKNKIEVDQNSLKIFTKVNEYSYIYKLFIAWAKKEFYKQAVSIYNNAFNNHFEQYALTKPKLVIRTMKSMWGNCKYVKGEITLNLFLIKAPLICLEYVVLHELSHLLFHDHGTKFKEFLSELMPNWKQYKKMLKDYSLVF